MKRTIALILLASALALLSGPSLPASGKALAEEAETDPYPWETCMTMGDRWSFKPGDRYKGGNFLLNIGPGPEGEFAPEALDRLRGIGEWMKVNSEAIYGTGPEWLSGYGRTLSGVTMSYHSPYPDITSTLIVRASDGTMAMEWETEPVPPGPVARPLTFLWLAGLATGKGAHRFDLSIDGAPVLGFRTSADSSRRQWRESGAGGVSLSFETAMVDQFDELFGFMRLEVPPALLQPGRPLRLRITGEKAGSNDWVMVFRDDLRRDVSAHGEQALVHKDGRLYQVVRVEVSRLAPPGQVVVSCDEAGRARLDLKTGYNALDFLVPADDKERRVSIEVAIDGGAVLRRSVLLRPVVPREIWLLPHSHIDIGYSDPQPVVERNHWRYLREAVDLAEKTAGYPEGSRFKWNIEQAWAVESYLRQAGQADRADFYDAVRKGSIGLQATLATARSSLRSLSKPPPPGREASPGRSGSSTASPAWTSR